MLTSASPIAPAHSGHGPCSARRQPLRGASRRGGERTVSARASSTIVSAASAANPARLIARARGRAERRDETDRFQSRRRRPPRHVRRAENRTRDERRSVASMRVLPPPAV